MYQHYLSTCDYLPEKDRLFMTRAGQLVCTDNTTTDELLCPNTASDDYEGEETLNPRVLSCRVSTRQSPHFKAFYGHHPVQLTL